MTKYKKFARSLKSVLLRDKYAEIPAFLGNLSGTVAADVTGRVYVTLFNGEVLEVFNGRVPNVPRLPVLIGYGGGEKLQILRSRDVYTSPPFPDVPPHAFLHTFPNADTVPVHEQQIMPLLVEPASGLTIRIHGGSYELEDGWHVFVTQEVDLTANVPASGAIYTLLEVDSTGAISATDGSAVDTRAMLEYSDIPAADPDKFALAAVKLYNGQSSFVFLPTDTDIIDLRFGRRTYPADLANIGAILSSVSADTPLDADTINFWDAVDAVLKKITWANVKAKLKTYFDTLYAAVSHVHDASVITYTPAVNADWDGSADPGDVDNALDQLAERTADLEAGGGGGHTIQDEGTPLTQRTNLNFVGARVAATDDAGNNATVITISNETAQTIGDLIEGSTNKATPVDADRFGFWDSVADILKYATWVNIKATLKTYFDTLYATLTGTDLYNFALNGGADFFQRVDPAASTSLTDGAYNGMDMWYSLIQGSGATEKRDSGIGTAEYSLRLTAGGTTNRYGKAQIIHSKKSIPLRGQTITAQFRVKPTNNAGSGTRDYRIAILAWTGTKNTVTRDVVNDWTSSNFTTSNFFASTSLSLIGTAAVTATHGVESVLSISGSVPTNCNNLIFFFWAEDVPTHASDYAQFSEIGLYISSTVQTWKAFDGELERCQKFFTKSYAPDIPPGNTLSTNAAGMYNDFTTQTVGWVGFKVTMEGSPTMVFYSPVTGSSGYIRSNGADAAVTGGVWGHGGIGAVYATLTAAKTSLFHYTAAYEL
jgi:hypothetical protein